MQRSLSAVVLVSAWALCSARAEAQTRPTSGAPPDPAAAVKAGSASAAEPPRKPDERLSDEAELAKVVNLYEAGKYRECGSELERLLDPTGRAPLRQSAIVENARVYWAACLIGAGQAELAEAPLRAAIHENPQMKPPDSLVFPQPVVQRFFKVRDSLVTEIRAAEEMRIKQAQAQAHKREQTLARDRVRMRELERIASLETIVVRNRRVLSFVPFGVGQLQNRREELGYTLMVSQALLATASVASIVVQSRLTKDADELQRKGQLLNEEQINSTIAGWGTARDITFWSFAVLVVGGVLQAQLDYKPEFRELRRRRLPPSLAPEAAPAPGRSSGSPGGVDVSAAPYFEQHGGGLSVMGRF